MDTDSVSFRSGSPADLESMYLLDRLCFREPFRFSRRAMAGFATQSGAVSLVAERSGELLAFLLAHPQGQALYLVTLDVHPVARRQGLAHQLLQGLESAAQDRGLGHLLLHVWTENREALALYRRERFQVIAEEPDYYGPGRDALVLGKDLAPA